MLNLTNIPDIIMQIPEDIMSKEEKVKALKEFLNKLPKIFTLTDKK